jgi:RNA polymerase sigma factor (sigma-70 family)
MLQAYLSLDKLNDPTRFKSWLYGIVLNLCRNDLRRQKVIYLSLETMVENLVDELLSIDSSSLDPQLVAEREELQTALLDAVDTLSDKNRLATLLFYHEQLSLQEVADRLNISIGAVKGRLHKARHQLRSILSPLQFPIQPTSLQEFSTMTTSTSTPAKLELCCSFCHKSQEQVDLLIAGHPKSTLRSTSVMSAWISVTTLFRNKSDKIQNQHRLPEGRILNWISSFVLASSINPPIQLPARSDVDNRDRSGGY